MIYYQEILLLPTNEIGMYALWEKIFQQVHLALVKNKRADNTSVIGISFPEYDVEEHSLGKKLRLFAKNEEDLNHLHFEKCLSYFKDYLYLGSIQNVPLTLKGYACFKHVKLNGSKEKLARRRAKRTGEAIDQALRYFKNFEEQHSKLPYIQMHSLSNGHRFRLFIEQHLLETPSEGSFSCYGLSGQSTVPLF